MRQTEQSGEIALMSSTVTVRFYAELNDFLHAERRFATFEVLLPSGVTVRDVLDGCGVPVPEVDLVLVNGEPEELNHPLGDGDRISVYPVFESFDIRGTTKVRVRALRVTRFVLDVHLGKLASYLRMLGFDTLYRNDYTDSELVRVSVEDDRILLSKDRTLVATGNLTRVYVVKCTDPRDQLKEVVRRFDLVESITPFTRCMVCNGALEPVEKERIVSRLPPRVAASFEEFRLCPDCSHVYWKGSHYRRMESFIQTIPSLVGQS